MSVEQDVFFVTVEGPRKLEVFSGWDGKDIGISDLLEEDGLQEFRFREEWLAWVKKQQEMFRQNANVKDHLPG